MFFTVYFCLFSWLDGIGGEGRSDRVGGRAGLVSVEIARLCGGAWYGGGCSHNFRARASKGAPAYPKNSTPTLVERGP